MVIPLVEPWAFVSLNAFTSLRHVFDSPRDAFPIQIRLEAGDTSVGNCLLKMSLRDSLDSSSSGLLLEKERNPIRGETMALTSATGLDHFLRS